MSQRTLTPEEFAGIESVLFDLTLEYASINKLRATDFCAMLCRLLVTNAINGHCPKEEFMRGVEVTFDRLLEFHKTTCTKSHEPQKKS